MIADASPGAEYLEQTRSASQRGRARAVRLVEVEQRADIVLVAGTSAWVEAFVRKLRSAGDPTPLLALNLTPANGWSARILDAGADDCVVCPFDPDELLARMQAVIRRKAPALACSTDIGADRSTQRIRVRNAEARVSSKQFAIFVYLAEHRERWVHSNAIIAAVSGTHHSPTTTLVRVQMHALRKALGPQRDCIRCDGHRSYMLTLHRA